MTWKEFCNGIGDCKSCELYKGKRHPVIGAGSLKAEIMFVGEAPGANEDQTGIPFSGAAGKVLDEVLAELKIPRDDVYIANVVKCRPPENRQPLKSEIDSCIGYLRNQVSFIKPKLIICLGAIAARTVLDPSLNMRKDHGIIIKRKETYIAATYHPAAVLYDPTLKRILISDMTNIINNYRTMSSMQEAVNGD